MTSEQGVDTGLTRPLNVLCPRCKRSIAVKIPPGKQVYEVLLMEDYKKSAFSSHFPWLEIPARCEEHGDMILWMIDGVRSAALLSPKYDSRVDAGEPKITSSPLARIIVWNGDAFERAFRRWLGSALAPNQVKRLGELLFCFLTFPSILFFGRFLAMAAVGVPQLTPSLWWTVDIWMTAGAVYFSFITLREMVVGLGELELIMTEDQRKRLYAPFAMAFNWLVFLLFFALFCLVYLSDQIGAFGFPPKGGLPASISWAIDAPMVFQTFFMVAGLQVFGAFGAFLYYMWSMTYERSAPGRLGPFDRPFRDLIPVVERFGEIAIHTVLFAGAAIATLELAKRALYDPSELAGMLDPYL